MKWSKKSDRELCQFFCLLLPSALHPLILSRIDSLCHQLIQKLGQSVEQNFSNWKLWIQIHFFLFDWKSIYKRVNAASRVFWTNDWSTVRCVSSNNVGKRVLITSFLSILQSRQSKEKFFMVGEIGTQSINAPKSFYTFFSKVSSPNQSYFYNRNSAIERQRNSNQKNVQGKKGQGKSVFSSGKKQFISDPSSFFCTNISFHGSSTDPIFFNDPIWWKVKIESRGCYKTIFDNHWEVASKGHNLEFWLGSTAQILWKIVVPGYAFWWIALWRSFSQTLWNHRGQTSKKKVLFKHFQAEFYLFFSFF